MAAPCPIGGGRDREGSIIGELDGSGAGRHPLRPRSAAAALAAACLALLLLPGGAAATETTYTYKVPISVAGYEVKQGLTAVPRPNVNGFVTKMETNLVDGDGKEIPIDRLMLHHIVFLNLAAHDSACDQLTDFDSRPLNFQMPERFYAAGEERAKLRLPPGYGYPISSGEPPWLVTYMFMNHRAAVDNGFLQYEVTVDDNPDLTPVKPHWLDVRNCMADPIYNVPGNGKKGSTHIERYDYEMPEAGRIVAGAGHTHGGARKLTITQPDCDNRRLAASTPTWGTADHPFYNVKPVLHEPGPIDMSAFSSQTGIPVRAGQKIRLNSRYENNLPHARVMGIMVIYTASDPGVTGECEPLPGDRVNTVGTDLPGRSKAPRYQVPLTGLDGNGNAIKIDAPPGALRKLNDGATVDVRDRQFSVPNARMKRGGTLNWRFSDSELHNVTLANGPRAIGSPNLNDDRTFSRKFGRKGTYRLFCSLHPVQMTERIEVEGRKANKKKRKKGKKGPKGR